MTDTWPPPSYHPDDDGRCLSTHPEDPDIRCKLLAGHAYAGNLDAQELHVGEDRRYWWREEPPIVVCYGPLEWEEDQQSNTYRATQWVETHIAPELTDWQRALLAGALEHRLADDRRIVNQALVAPKGTDPTDAGGWQELGFISDDGLTLDDQPGWHDTTPANEWADIHHKLNERYTTSFEIELSRETTRLLYGYDPYQLADTTRHWEEHPHQEEAPPLEPIVPIDQGDPPSRNQYRHYPQEVLLDRLRLRWCNDPYRRWLRALEEHNHQPRLPRR